jgi:hypothetical protein
MKRLVLATLFLAALFLAAGCTSSPFSQIVGPGAAGSFAPAPTDVATSPRPKPTPTVLSLGEAYIVVADAYNHARARLLSMPGRSWTLADFKIWCGDLAGMTDEYVVGIGKIPFTATEMKKHALALAKESNLESKAFKRCAAAKSMATVKRNLGTVDSLTPSGVAAAQKLRLDLGLSTRSLY